MTDSCAQELPDDVGRDEASGRYRLGVVVPPSNPTVEVELRAALPKSVALYVARFDPHPDLALEERLSAYRAEVSAPLDRLAGLALDAILITCTGCCYPLGESGDADWSQQLTERSQVPVYTAAGAISRMMRRYGCDKLGIVSPYPEWLTKQAVGFLADAGYDIQKAWTIPGDGSIYNTDPGSTRKTLDSAIEYARSVPGMGLVVTGTGASSLRVIEGAFSSVPIISSNIAGIYDLLDALGGAALVKAARNEAVTRLISFDRFANER